MSVLRRLTALLQGPLAEGLFCALLAVALTWPMVLQPSQYALGSSLADGMKHLWTLWWMRESVWGQGALPFATKLINFPIGMELYPIEPLNGLLAVALPFLDIVTVSNLLVLLNLTATGVAAAFLGREAGGSRAAGFAAAALLEGSAVMAFFVHVGVGELNHLWWLPLGLGCLLRARRTLDWRWFFALSASLVGAMLSCFYLGFFLAVAVSLYALATLWAGGQTPGLLLRYAVAAGLALAVVWPVTQAFASSYKSGDVPQVGLWSYLSQEHGQPVTDPASARLELQRLFTPGHETTRREDLAYGGGRYIGLIALGLAAVALVRQPRKALPWLLIGAVGVIFALGSFYTEAGEAVLSGGKRLRMPILYLNRLLGYVAEPLNFPSRFLAMTAAALAALGALAVGSLRGRGWMPLLGLALLAPAEMIWGDQLGWPWARFALRDASALEVLRQGPDLAVIDLALAVRADTENRANALVSQIAHGKKTQAVPIERIEYFARDGFRFVKTLPLITDLQPLYENKAGAVLSGDYRRDIVILRDVGFGWILVTYRNGEEQIPSGIQQELTRVLGGPPVAMGAGMAAWALPELPFTQVEIDRWRIEQQKALRDAAQRPESMGPPLR